MPNNEELSSHTSDHQVMDEKIGNGTSEGPDKRQQNLRLGSKILSQAHFEEKYPAVDFTFQQARRHGENLPGNNNERRNYAYLSYLQNLINKHGNKVEKRLWQASINDDLLVKYEDIPESHWDSKRQEHRDEGFGSVELTESLKHQYCEIYQKQQRESLQKWAEYLGDEQSPYPLWFKVYAWHGITKMGVYNKQKRVYEVRNKTTVAPYPDPDAEILAGIFDVVNHYYGNNESQCYTEEGERNIDLEGIVWTGSFIKIFNAIQQDIAPIVEPPEKPEDVHGEWVEYQPGEEADIARAARGTGWCVASSAVGRHYLKYGTYGTYEDDYHNENDENNEHHDNDEEHLKSKFILFHLKDPETGKLSKNAVASIRLDLDGRVAEISGLKKGQALNDSLVPMVEDKVKSLPGGEEYLPKFYDKQELIRLDHKMENGEDLTKEELEFIYEIHRPIQTLDTYNTHDPRIKELRAQYDIEYAIDHGVDANRLISKLDSSDIADNLDALINHSADINQLVSGLGSPYYIINNLDTLINHGANIDINQLVSGLGQYDIAHNLDTLINYGADINQLVSGFGLSDIINNLDTLINHGADINQLVSGLDLSGIINNLDPLINHGADINQLVSGLGQYDIAHNLDTLINYGADINQLVSRLDSYDIHDNLDTLINYGADINQLVSGLSPYGITYNLDTLINHGANININQLVSELNSSSIANNLDTLINHGADINQLVSRLDSFGITYNLDTLINHGADINQLISGLGPAGIARSRDILRRHGANV